MALIGTISGSVGASNALTSTTAISGTLVIADEPLGRFPSLQSGVKLFVSGNKTSLGADTPNAIFGGDTFVSGAFGTDSYIQMKPVTTLQIPTNTTASYIYTSGSTNDLYFTQYQPGTGYTNTTRLRWIEGILTTGLLHGGIVSTANGTTTFSVTAGSGLIATPNATISSDPYPTLRLVEWPAFTSSSLEYSGSAQVSYITINASGELAQLNTPPTLAQFKDRIILGRVLHQTGSVTNGAINAPATSFSAAANIFDFVRPFGPLKVSGHTLAASGSTLGLTKTEGDSYAEGRNYAFDPSNPNTILSSADPALVNCKIYYQYVSGSTTITNTGTANAGFAVINPGQYNNNGTLAAVGNSEWTNQRVYWFPRSVNRALFVYYGVTKYATLDAAVASVGSEAFVEGSNTKDSAIFVGVVSVKGNETNLSDTVNAKITQAGLFRGSFGGGGVGGGSTPPAGSTTQVQFNDAGAFGGDPNFTFDNITHALTVVGDITGSNLRLTGDAAVIGGDLTTTATTFNLANATATTVNLGGGASAVNIGAAGSATTFAGNITGSNALLSGDLALNGGDLTSTAGTLNIATGLATQLNVGGTTPIIEIGTFGGSSSTRLAYGQTASPAVKTVEIGTRGNSGSTTNVTIGSATAGALGRITLSHDVALTTGNIIGAPGSGANVMTLISSGNLIAKLDTDASADGHRFAVQDYRNIDQFSVGENGNAEISGSLVVTGSIAVNSGNITSTASTLNISPGTGGVAFQLSGSSFITFVSGANGPLQQATIQAGSSKNLVLAAGLGAGRQVVLSGSSIEIRAGISGSPNGVDFSTDAGAIAQSYLNITSGSYTAGGVTVTNAAKIVPGDAPQSHDLLVGASATRSLYLSGSSVVANMGNSGFSFQRDGSSYGVIQGVSGSSFTIGSAAGVISMNLVSSGNVTVRLDSDNNAPGHQFQVQDYRGINQFLVGENGNSEISGSLVVSGSSIQTVTTTTYNLLTTALTGTLNVGSLATNILVGGTTTTSSFTGAAQIDGRSTLSSITEKMVPSVGGTGTVAYDLSLASIFYANGPTGDITANFTNVPTTNNRIITPTVILSQSATARIVSAVQIDTAAQTINWANGVTPTGTANKQDVFGFSLIRSGSTWKVLGQMSTYG